MMIKIILTTNNKEAIEYLMRVVGDILRNTDATFVQVETYEEG